MVRRHRRASPIRSEEIAAQALTRAYRGSGMTRQGQSRHDLRHQEGSEDKDVVQLVSPQCDPRTWAASCSWSGLGSWQMGDSTRCSRCTQRHREGDRTRSRLRSEATLPTASPSAACAMRCRARRWAATALESRSSCSWPHARRGAATTTLNHAQRPWRAGLYEQRNRHGETQR